MTTGPAGRPASGSEPGKPGHIEALEELERIARPRLLSRKRIGKLWPNVG